MLALLGWPPALSHRPSWWEHSEDAPLGEGGAGLAGAQPLHALLHSSHQHPNCFRSVRQSPLGKENNK